MPDKGGASSKTPYSGVSEYTRNPTSHHSFVKAFSRIPGYTCGRQSMSGLEVEAVTELLLVDSQEDYVGLWQIPWHLHRQLPDADVQTIRRLSEEVVRGLVDAGLQIGDVVDGRGFVAWEPTGAVERLLNSWDALGREPTIYEIAWFYAEPS